MPTPLSLPLALLLALAPPLATEPAPPDADTYEQLLADITRTSALLNEGEDVGDELEALIIRLVDQAPYLAADETAQQLRIRALLNLARARLLAQVPIEAAAAMDEAIRLGPIRALEVADYGPALEALYREREAALAEVGSASIRIVCSVPCVAYIDEQASALESAALMLGIHRVWIEASDADSSAAPQTYRVYLDSAGAVVELRYSPRLPPPPADPKLAQPKPPPMTLAYAGLATASVGVVITILGASIWAADPNDPLDQAHMQYIVRRPEFGTTGKVLTTLGVLAGAVGASLLAVDLNRRRSRLGTLALQAAPGYAGVRFRARF